MTALDWPAMIRIGLRELRLVPREFWALTPAELAVMAGVDDARAPMGRSRFEELQARYPDNNGD